MAESAKNQFHNVQQAERSSLAHRMEHLDEASFCLHAAMKNLEQAKLRMTGYENNIDTYRPETATDRGGMKQKIDAAAKSLGESMDLVDVEKGRITGNVAARSKVFQGNNASLGVHSTAQGAKRQGVEEIAQGLQAKAGSGQSQEQHRNQQPELER